MSFHRFHVQEVYSNANGDVQYVEFVGDGSGQHIWASHQILSNTDATFNITTNLPSTATDGKSVLVATQGYAALGLATPDYVIPNDFFFINNGMVDFPGMTDGDYPGFMEWMSLPTNGVQALDHFGAIVTNSPFNFAGVSGAIPGNPMLGTATANNITGTAASDFIVGLGGNDIVNGGSGNDTIKGGDQNDNLNGGVGADRIQGDAGNDTMVWATTDFFNGGIGTDGLRIMSGSLNLITIPNSKIIGVEKIDMTAGGNNTLTVNSSEVLALSTTSNILTVLGNPGDTVNLMGAFALQSTAGGFETWKLGAAVVKIETELNVI